MEQMSEGQGRTPDAGRGAGPGREHRFRQIYEDLYPDLLRFVQRRSGFDGAVPEDVVAEAFLAVWRRFDDLPAGRDAGRAWVFGVARNILLNSRRGARRRTALGVRLARVEPAPAPGVDVSLQVDLGRAWPRLSATHQEALALAVFEDLDSTEAAAVLGISATAFRLRLSRARAGLRKELEVGPETAAGPVTSDVSPAQPAPSQLPYTGRIR